MPRRQIPNGFSIPNVDDVAAVPLSAVEKNVTSFIVQAPLSNDDFVFIGSSTEQTFQIAPGKDFEVNGDNLDNGTTAYTNLADWFVKSQSGVQTVNVMILEGY